MNSFSSLSIYQVGGSLPVAHPTYVKRQADEDFYQGLKAGEFCYVLNSRQMGKSSLRVQTMARLQGEGIACAAIDLTEIGTSDITVEEWYAGIIDSLVNSFHLDETFDLETWWTQHSLLSPVQKLSKFVEDILLKQLTGKIVIFIDEIDSTLKLSFKDDFFALIRAFYNKRTDNTDFYSLTFGLLGVATPSDLMKDRNRTPFNIGKAIDLKGFQLGEVKPLEKGLVGKADNPEAVLQEILKWTGGQPFLTQRVCRLVVNSPFPITAGSEGELIEKLAYYLIDNWESQDEQAHLKTICDRFSSKEKEQMVSRLLGLYQQILQQEEIEADGSPEQMNLRLTGLVVQRNQKLQVYNPIYKEVFNQDWVGEELSKLRPYSEAITAWLQSNRRDDGFRLLRGEALEEALKWKTGKQLSLEDEEFLDASQKKAREIQEKDLATEKERNQILTEAGRKAKRRIQIGSAILGITLLAAGITSIIGYKAQQDSVNARQEAAQQLKIANNAKEESGQKQRELQSATENLNTLNERVKSIEQKRKEAQKQAKQTKARLNSAQEKEKKAEKAAQIALDKEKIAQTELTGVKREIANAKQRILVATQRARTAEKQAAQVQQRISGAELRIQRANQTAKAAEVEAKKARKEANEAEQVQKQMQAQAKAAQDLVGRLDAELEKIQQAINTRIWEARILTNIGEVYSSIGQPEQALKYFNQALAILQKIGDRTWEAITLIDIGEVYSNIGQPQQALDFYDKGLFLQREVGNRQREGATLSKIGTIYSYIGQFQEALKYDEQALLIHRGVGNRPGEARTLSNIGEVYQALGQPQKALDYSQQALLIQRKVGDRPGEARTLSNIGEVYQALGQSQEALKYYQQALPIQREVGDRFGEVSTLKNIGIFYRDTNQPTQAIANLEQSSGEMLQIRGSLQRENRQTFLKKNGSNAKKLGKPKTAADYIWGEWGDR